MAHQQVIEDQPGDQLGLVLVQAEARTQLARHLRAEDGMVPLAALGDVVKQCGDICDAARIDLVDEAGCARMVRFQLALLDLAEQADGADGVLVHRVVVVHVELHLSVDLAEIGHEAAEHAGLVHPAQDRFGIVPAAQQVEEQSVGARVFAHGIVDQFRIACRLPHGFGVDFEVFRLGDLEDLDQPDRVLAEVIVRGCRDTPAEDAVALEDARLLPERREKAAARGALGQIVLDMGEEDAGQAAHPLRLQEIELHEPLDRALARAIGEIHPLRHAPLKIEGEPVVRAAGQDVHVAAHGEQKPLCPAEGAVFIVGHQADIDQFRRTAHTVDELADPVERLEIAQATLAILDVGFDDIAAVAHAAVARIALFQFLAEEGAFVALHHLGGEPALALFIKVAVAPDVAPFEQRGPDREVVFR